MHSREQCLFLCQTKIFRLHLYFTIRAYFMNSSDHQILYKTRFLIKKTSFQSYLLARNLKLNEIVNKKCWKEKHDLIKTTLKYNKNLDSNVTYLHAHRFSLGQLIMVGYYYIVSSLRIFIFNHRENQRWIRRSNMCAFHYPNLQRFEIFM